MIRNTGRYGSSSPLLAVGILLLGGILQGSLPPASSPVDSDPQSPDSLEASTARELEALQKVKYLGAGRFRGFRSHGDDEGLTEEQRRLIEQLETIGYLSGSTQAPALVGVTVHDADRVCAGLNFYTSGHAPEAVLTNMDGTVLHRWEYDIRNLWPQETAVERPLYNWEYWRRAYLFANGDILAIYEGLGMVKLDKDSNVIWAHAGREHHDLEVLPNGDVYVLTREARMIPRLAPARPIQEDFVSILDSNGNETRRISLVECFENSDEYSYMLLKRRKRSGDIFHTNSLEVLDGRVASEAPAFKVGRVLTSIRHLDAIAVVDLDLEEVVWAYQGDFRQQHDPRILDNGHLLLFNNNLGEDAQSVVLEYDLTTMEVVWEFRGTAEEPFYSRSCGTAQRLANGNTLITESDNGRAMEVTPDKTIVWEFYNPERAGEDDEFIATLFELIRLDPDFPVDWADGR